MKTLPLWFALLFVIVLIGLLGRRYEELKQTSPAQRTEPATTNALCRSTGTRGDRVQLDAEMLLHNDTQDEVYCETRMGPITGYFLMAPHEVKSTRGMRDVRCWRSP